MKKTKIKLKLTIVGDHNVGKTSILNSFLDKSTFNTPTTLGIDFFTKIYKLDDCTIQMTLWDTAGSERFHSLTPAYTRGSNIVIVVYDLSKARSNINYWLRKIESDRPNIVGILGNKTDITTVNNEDLQDILFPYSRQHWNIITGKCSSRNSNSVKNFFRQCIKQHVRQDLENPFKLPIISILEPKKKVRTCCT
tara:strand:+ start:9129 stop:9710 length:582 start_codon:yes stop_codon:yes gene_type:complete